MGKNKVKGKVATLTATQNTNGVAIVPQTPQPTAQATQTQQQVVAIPKSSYITITGNGYNIFWQRQMAGLYANYNNMLNTIAQRQPSITPYICQMPQQQLMGFKGNKVATQHNWQGTITTPSGTYNCTCNIAQVNTTNGMVWQITQTATLQQ